MISLTDFFQRNRWARVMLVATSVVLFVLCSHLYLQWCQNDLSLSLALKFAFEWHTEKFLLGTLVLVVLYLWVSSVAGSLFFGGIFYGIFVGVLGITDYLKMLYRMEPIYPDDLKMVSELGLLREMAGNLVFFVALVGLVLGIAALIYSVKRSLKLGKWTQIMRGVVFIITSGLLMYVFQFNQPGNLLRKAYNRTALWISYSQKMNYYNTGFVGGFLYNLDVDAMEKPAGYSKAKVEALVKRYQQKATERNKQVANVDEASPHIVFVMSESFSDPLRLNGFTLSADPLAAYRKAAKQSYSGQMLSQNYGGGTANIEFEALTSFSMEPLNGQMTTPYTMLVSQMKTVPNAASLLKERGYTTSAIHPYNTSMYKRKDVYEKMGFEVFLDEKTMTHQKKLENNPYISDQAAYDEVYDLLSGGKVPQFVHLVTMQTHMPYSGKYPNSSYEIASGADSSGLTQYAQDIDFSSQALAAFMQKVKGLDRRVILVFWGDHLPSIYSGAVKQANSNAMLHETEFLIYDSQESKAFQNDADEGEVLSPVYFLPEVLDRANLKTTGYYEMLSELRETLPAFEKELYYQDGLWSETLELTGKDKQLYEDYCMIEYDMVSGSQYSDGAGLFKDIDEE